MTTYIDNDQGHEYRINEVRQSGDSGVDELTQRLVELNKVREKSPLDL